MSKKSIGAILLELSALDQQLRKVDKQLGALPQKAQLAELDQAAAQIAAKAQQVVDLRARQERQLRALKDEATIVQSRIVENQQHIEAHSDNFREVANLSDELDLLAKRAEKIDHDSGGLRAGLEKIAAVEKQVRESEERLEGKRASLENAYQIQAADLLHQKQQLGTDREALITAIPDDLVTRYEKLRSQKRGVAVATLDARYCQGCHMELTEGQAARVKQEADANGIGECPVCHRMLVFD